MPLAAKECPKGSPRQPLLGDFLTCFFTIIIPPFLFRLRCFLTRTFLSIFTPFYYVESEYALVFCLTYFYYKLKIIIPLLFQSKETFNFSWNSDYVLRSSNFTFVKCHLNGFFNYFWFLK